MNKIKRYISIFLAALILTMSIPVGDFVAFAGDNTDPKIYSIVVTKKHINITEGSTYSMSVRGNYFLDSKGESKLNIGIVGPDGTTNPFIPKKLDMNTIEYSGISESQISGEILVNGESLDISVELPTLSKIYPSNGIINSDEGELTLIGNNFNLLNSKERDIEGVIISGNDNYEFREEDVIKNTQIISDVSEREPGKYNVYFKETKDIEILEQEVELINQNNYLDVFTIYQNLNIKKPVDVAPTRGSLGSRVELSSEGLLTEDRMSVFLVKDLNDKLTLDHMSKFENFREENDRQIFTFEVPETLKNVYGEGTQGEYYIVLTNNIDSEKGNPKKDITSRTELEQRFTVVDGGDSMSLKSPDPIDPNEGSSTGGTKAVISGRYIASMSPNVHNPAKGEEPNIKAAGEELVIKYRDGEYSKLGPVAVGQNSIKYEELERRIQVQIGNPVLFDEYSETNTRPNSNGRDSLAVTIPPITLKDGESPIKNVYVFVKTKMSYYTRNGKDQILDGDDKPVAEDENGKWYLLGEDGKKTNNESNNPPKVKYIEFSESDLAVNAFTYLPIDYTPKIDGVVPDLIPVDKAGNVKPEGIELIIHGENFTLHRYRDKDGNVRYKYPVIDLAGDNRVGSGNISINKNEDNNISLKIFDKSGKEIEGSRGDNLGNKIVVQIPEGSSVKSDKINKNENIMVTNPILNSENIEEGNNGVITNMGSSSRSSIRFVNIDDMPNKIPVITELSPRIINVSGHRNAIITGSNFLQGLTLYLDGEEIKDVKINDTGTELTFDLPEKLEGEYSIIVQNEDGPLAKTKVEYIRSYTNIRFRDFNPKKGTAGTVVTVTGGGFLRPANTKITNIDIASIAKRLIGTTVYLGGEDVNEYNLDDNDKIILEHFNTKDKLLGLDDKSNLKLADYFHSLILVEGGVEEENYYSIYYDGVTGEYKLSDSVDEYVLEEVSGEIKARLRGVEYSIKQEDGKLKLKNNEIEKTFEIKTPYEIKDGEIVGNRVKIINDTELTFEVPRKSREGYHDVKLENPDTNSVSREGNNGFYYSYQPNFNPKIDKIVPNEGSVNGGYSIKITPKKDEPGLDYGFVDNGGNDKTSVTIGSVAVPAENISIDGDDLIVIVPKYPGELENETDLDRKSVNVVVVNPDGGSDSVENGFTYVISKSRPKLTGLFSREGSAAGEEIVSIEGSQFRFFEPFDDKNNNSKWDEDEEYTDINKNGKFDDLRSGKVYVKDSETKEYKKVNIYDLINEDGSKSEEWKEYVKPILPKIKFVTSEGEKEAEILNFESGKIEVLTPRGVNGNAQVYLTNNDYGVSNRLTYEYKVTNPQINSVAPSVVSKTGGQEIQILGENFVESKIDVIKSETESVEKRLQLVQFGGLENKYVSNKNSKNDEHKYRGNKAKVKVDNLEVIYDGSDSDNKKLFFEVGKGPEDDKKIYKFEYNGWDENDIYLPMNKLMNFDEEEPEKYNVTELVKISSEKIPGAQTTKRLRVDRGFSPEAKLENPNDIIIVTPTYYTIGETVVRVINADGQEVQTGFRYANPSSKPEIKRLFRNGESGVEESGFEIFKVPYTGGSKIKVEGLDFQRGAEIKIGEKKIENLEYYPEYGDQVDYIVFEMPPEADESRIGQNLRLSLTNPDYGSTITNKIRIRFTKPETVNLSITGMIPDSGPTKGGTEVTIHGNDFRREMEGYKGKLKVYFEKGDQTVSVPESDIKSIGFTKIVLDTPAFSAGPVNIIVENPDGNTVRLLDGFTYTSDPKITSVVDPENDKLVVENISVEGGERVKIKGSDFLEGATVTFNPELEAIADDVKDENLPQGEIVVINGKRYVLKSGVEGIDVEVLDGQNILVTTPEGKLGDKGVLVRNSDGGVSNVYNIEYGIPEVGAPFNVRAELVYDEFIRVTWEGVRNALEYEIYVSEDGKAFEYVDSTELTSYAYQDIKPRTKYEFMVRAIGQYGSSEPLDESKSNIVRTGYKAGPEDIDGELGENTVVERQGNLADISIGSRDFGSAGYTIDLTRGNLAGVKDLTIRMPAEIVTSYSSGEIRVLGTDYSMTFSPSVFRNNALESNKNNPNAGVVFKVNPYNGSYGNAGGRTVAGPRYELQGETYIDKNRTKVGRLAGGISFNLDTNNLLVQSRNLRNIGLSRYFEGNNSWINTQSVDRMAIYTMTGSRR